MPSTTEEELFLIKPRAQRMKNWEKQSNNSELVKKTQVAQFHVKLLLARRKAFEIMEP